jgi:hypothetical protein
MAGNPTPSEAAAAAKKGKQLTPEELQARRDQALAAAKRAEYEAAAAAAECDAAAAHARDALKRAVAARAEAAADDPYTYDDKDNPPDADAASDRANPDHNLHHAMFLHEAAAVVNLLPPRSQRPEHSQPRPRHPRPHR